MNKIEALKQAQTDFETEEHSCGCNSNLELHYLSSYGYMVCPSCLTKSGFFEREKDSMKALKELTRV